MCVCTQLQQVEMQTELKCQKKKAQSIRQYDQILFWLWIIFRTARMARVTGQKYQVVCWSVTERTINTHTVFWPPRAELTTYAVCTQYVIKVVFTCQHLETVHKSFYTRDVAVSFGGNNAHIAPE